ncbi:carboxypeptidase-like regulatory domain-containing protein [Sphingobacterium daejeonense]|uniref:carboxypeptidase-like regulatory domain-containing protein n=1 Tax=Sphingobacterium daejeonense TaxID=371142 RepID=UPI0010C48675|nr:carboxypeptidase-like regulatory domain-containing protein [Sphingobacterium daejeonense]VTQ03955.1 TonB-linked outer membrane protein, SusC/RagA family [Sphingobacterium daejeonense]
MNKIFAFIVLLLTLGSSGLAQQRTITGTVKDADSKAVLSGVEISVQGKNTATLTDNNGAYSIKVEDSDVLFI